MKIAAGPEINIFTSCCDSKQKEQYRVFVGTEPTAACAVFCLVSGRL